MKPVLRTGIVAVIAAGKRAVKMGLIAVIAYEIAYLIMACIGGSDPIKVITRFSGLNQLDRVLEFRIVLGEFVVGAVNGAVKATAWLLILGEALSPWSLVFTIMDSLSGATEWHLGVMPLGTTIVAAFPTLVFLMVRAAAWVASRFKKPDLQP